MSTRVPHAVLSTDSSDYRNCSLFHRVVQAVAISGVPDTLSAVKTCHYRKLRPDASKAVSINDTWRGQRVNRLPAHHRDVTGIENERRPGGSSPRRARSLDEKACFCLRKSVSAKRARRARYGATKRLSRAPFVSMVQATHLRNRNDTTVLRSVYGSRLRRIFR